MDPLSIVASTLAIVGAISTSYKTIKKISGLPDAFAEVGNQLPLVDRILLAIKRRLRSGPDQSMEEEAAIAAKLKECEDKFAKLAKIFEALEKKVPRDTGTASDAAKAGIPWEKARAAYRSVLAGVKANRVETLMQSILESLDMLARLQIFEAATREGVKALEDAIKKLSSGVPPSLEDSEMEGSEGITASQNVESGGKGQQNNAIGDYNTFQSGEYVGQNIYFGKEPPKATN
jgi:hypothetical protein